MNNPRLSTRTPATRGHAVTASSWRVSEVVSFLFLLFWPFRRVPEIQNTSEGEVQCAALKDDSSRPCWSFCDSAHPAESRGTLRLPPWVSGVVRLRGRREGEKELAGPHGPRLPPWMCAALGGQSRSGGPKTVTIRLTVQLGQESYYSASIFINCKVDAPRG